jgi:XTP/dITP diphosphohydrolase
MQLLIATHNAGKAREYTQLLTGLPLHLTTPDDLGLDLKVKESGDTYSSNARLKALAYAQASGLMTLADDSGLEVDALEGAPGVRSARYAPGQDQDRIRALLAALAREPDKPRSARFRCVIVLANPEGQTWETQGVCKGLIIDERRGEGGFGYDPIFYLPSQGLTMAELTPEEKNQISHRARATHALRPILQEIFSLRT